MTKISPRTPNRTSLRYSGFRKANSNLLALETGLAVPAAAFLSSNHSHLPVGLLLELLKADVLGIYAQMGCKELSELLNYLSL